MRAVEIALLVILAGVLIVFAFIPKEKAGIVPVISAPAGILTGHVTIGPLCPVERIDMPCLPTPETYASRKIVVYDARNSALVQRVTINSIGDYRVELSPGTYVIDVEPAGGFRSSTRTITIESGKTATLDIDIDTGIR